MTLLLIANLIVWVSVAVAVIWATLDLRKQGIKIVGAYKITQQPTSALPKPQTIKGNLIEAQYYLNRARALLERDRGQTAERIKNKIIYNHNNIQELMDNELTYYINP
jgi:hypothetical protein